MPPKGLGLGVCGAPKAAPDAAGAPNKPGEPPDCGVPNIPPAIVSNVGYAAKINQSISQSM